MKLKPYSKYKDSGIQWIGEIPEGWEVRKLKFNYEIIGKTNIPASEGREEGKFPFFTSGESTKYVDEPIIQGEFVVVGDGCIPNFKYYNGKFSYSDHCFLLKSYKQINLKFLFYFLIGNLDPLDVLCFHGMGLRNLDKYNFNSFLACFASLIEQNKIVSFLDSKTSEINRTIEKNKKLISLLKEKRTALINHVVTKGLNPKAKMKDSEINWIGEIPESWDVERAKVIFDEVDNRCISGQGELLTVSHITGVTKRSEKVVYMFLAETLEGYKKCKKKDLVINTMWAWMGAMGISFEEGLISPSYNVYRFRNEEYIPKYYDYLVRTPRFTSIVKSKSKGVWDSRLRLYPEYFFNIKMPIPPTKIQIKIANYLDKEIKKIDTTILQIKKHIILLEEYKKSLIHYVVTGKVNVRGVEA